MKVEYENLSELKQAILNKEVNEKDLEIFLDNDLTSYYIKGKEILVNSAGNGYSDYRELYECFFPDAELNNC